jgi:hypothetical protein
MDGGVNAMIESIHAPALIATCSTTKGVIGYAFYHQLELVGFRMMDVVDLSEWEVDMDVSVIGVFCKQQTHTRVWNASNKLVWKCG